MKCLRSPIVEGFRHERKRKENWKRSRCSCLEKGGEGKGLKTGSLNSEKKKKGGKEGNRFSGGLGKKKGGGKKINIQMNSVFIAGEGKREEKQARSPGER